MLLCDSDIVMMCVCVRACMCACTVSACGMCLMGHSAAFAVVAWLDPLVSLGSSSSGKATFAKKGGELLSDAIPDGY